METFCSYRYTTSRLHDASSANHAYAGTRSTHVCISLYSPRPLGEGYEHARRNDCVGWVRAKKSYAADSFRTRYPFGIHRNGKHLLMQVHTVFPSVLRMTATGYVPIPAYRIAAAVRYRNSLTTAASQQLLSPLINMQPNLFYRNLREAHLQRL